MKTAEELRLEIAGLVQEFADLKYTKKYSNQVEALYHHLAR